MSRKESRTSDAPTPVQLELFPGYSPPIRWKAPNVPDGCRYSGTCFTCPFPDCVIPTSGPGSRERGDAS